MKEANSLSYMNSVKEMLLDERRLVTYVSLSKELCIHVNESKLLLTRILEEIRQSNKNVILNVNYIISGLIGDNKAYTAICNETQMSEQLAQFKTVFFQHLYSLCVGTPSADNVAFSAINKFEDYPLCTGLIKSNLCVKRLPEELSNLRNTKDVQSIPEISQKPSTTVQKKVKEECKKESNNTGVDAVSKVQRTVSEPAIKAELPKKDVSNNSVSKADSKNNKKSKGIAGFFNKASTSTKKSTDNTKVKPKAETEKSTGLKEDCNADVVIKSEKMEVDEVINNIESRNGNGSKKSNNSLDKIKKTAKVDKKRKRVLHVSDSESEEEKNDPFADEPPPEPESDDEIPPTPLANTVKITSGIINPKKKRKIVDKTYTDEDGYILTKKEEVYESCSEPEEETNVKENIKSFNKVSPLKKTEISPKEKKNGVKNKKKLNSPQKGKQATLMNFFKKI